MRVVGRGAGTRPHSAHIHSLSRTQGPRSPLLLRRTAVPAQGEWDPRIGLHRTPAELGEPPPHQAHLDSLRPRGDPTAPLPWDRTEARRARKHHNGSAQRSGQSSAAPLASLCSGSGERRVSLETGAPPTAASSNPAPGRAQTRPHSVTSQGPLPCPHSVPPSVPAPPRVLVFYLSPRERGDLARPSPPGTLTSMSSRGWTVSL